LIPADSPERQEVKESLFKLIRQHGLTREFPLIISTLKAFSQGKVKVAAEKVIDSQGRLINGYNLTDEIDKVVKEVIQ